MDGFVMDRSVTGMIETHNETPRINNDRKTVVNGLSLALTP
jgi:hypothetical protein